jgi:hypothetical protein
VCRLVSRPLPRLCGVCEADGRRGLELDGALGCFGWGWTPGALWRISRRLLEFFEELVARDEVERL